MIIKIDCTVHNHVNEFMYDILYIYERDAIVKHVYHIIEINVFLVCNYNWIF